MPYTVLCAFLILGYLMASYRIGRWYWPRVMAAARDYAAATTDKQGYECVQRSHAAFLKMGVLLVASFVATAIILDLVVVFDQGLAFLSSIVHRVGLILFVFLAVAYLIWGWILTFYYGHKHIWSS